MTSSLEPKFMNCGSDMAFQACFNVNLPHGGMHRFFRQNISHKVVFTKSLLARFPLKLFKQLDMFMCYQEYCTFCRQNLSLWFEWFRSRTNEWTTRLRTFLECYRCLEYNIWLNTCRLEKTHQTCNNIKDTGELSINPY